ncbi:PREDICTED: uncharacterized protein LOC109361096 [Lupinus angustifolius]|uniref:uncharacterized protein LOC109361096 n=1 Tax=Lupinus angustifolius TaxID=3871 RepID=UPI00092FB563|nr:PREDICTED: uncharacterized protein LOC109361096 [Lupinus angustifolius]
MSGDGVDEILYPPKDNNIVPDYLTEYTFEGRWDKVIDMYNDSPEVHTAMISKTEGTALHMAVDLYEEEVVAKVVDAMIRHGTVYKALTKANELGDTPLHVAASRGFAKICKCIIGGNNERIDLMSEKNKMGETPLFQAAINWQKQAFAYLSQVSRDSVVLAHLVRESDGDSILHCAIEREYFDLAVIILRYYDFLSTHTNKEGFTPLKVLATRPSAFRSSSNLSWWKLILYQCTLVAPLEPESKMRGHLRKMDKLLSHKMNFPENYATLYMLVSKSLSFFIGKMPWEEKKPDTENPRSNEHSKCLNIEVSELVSKNQKVGFFPQNYTTIQQFVRSVYVHILGLSGVELKTIKKMKKNHKWSEQLLKALMQRPYSAFTGAGGLPETADSSVDDEMLKQFSRWNKKQGHPGTLATQESIPTEAETPSEASKPEKDDKDGIAYKMEITKNGTEAKEEVDLKETPFLVAARYGIVEMVHEILNEIPSAIHNTNKKKENVLLVAVKNRQPLVIDTIRMRMKTEVWNNLLLAVDDDENTMLHLAAQALGKDMPWQIAGSALQMVWDIKWFQYIKSLVPQHFYFRNNIHNKTAGEIFKESHKDLVADSGEWLKDTSESCSVVSGLVAGVSFAAASSIPGGTNDEGRPALEGKTAFDVFAISSLIGLCFSVTGLIMFLAILTSRKEARDFRRDLPLKLLIGLSSLFVSIASMFVSFCSGHIFMLNNKYRTFLIPIYASTCLPVCFYAIAQFPLYFDLIIGILTKVPKGSNKGDSL